MKLKGSLYLAAIGIAVAAILLASGEIVPATNAYQAEMRIWLIGRASGIASVVLLTAVTMLGIVLSHPEQSRWKQSKRLYPIHELVWVFTIAFLAVHVVSLAVDAYAEVGWLGAVVPGMSSYRTPAVALGTFAAYGLVLTGLTARLTRLLPPGWCG